MAGISQDLGDPTKKSEQLLLSCWQNQVDSKKKKKERKATFINIGEYSAVAWFKHHYSHEHQFLHWVSIWQVDSN